MKLANLLMAAMPILGGSLIACTGSASDQNSDQTQPKSLVLYYSQTGTTRTVAEALQQALDADIEAIELENPYDGDYGETIARVSAERNEGILPALKPLSHNLADYDVIYLGYPVWFGTYAPPVEALIQTEDLSGKKVVPFCTFGSGGLEATVSELAANLPDAEVAAGYGVRTARIDSMPGELNRFLIENGYIKGEIAPLPDFSVQMAVTPEETEIFNAATADYMFPLGTAVTCGHRPVPGATEYMFVACSNTPDGAQAYNSILVLQPDSVAGQPAPKAVFTRVIR